MKKKSITMVLFLIAILISIVGTIVLVKQEHEIKAEFSSLADEFEVPEETLTKEEYEQELTTVKQLRAQIESELENLDADADKFRQLEQDSAELDAKAEAYLNSLDNKTE